MYQLLHKLLKYKIARNLPVARFYYKGHHSHPVKRTVLVVAYTRKMIQGYELREGSKVYNIEDAQIKSYLRSKIASPVQCRQESPARRVRAGKTTLNKHSLVDILKQGV